MKNSIVLKTLELAGFQNPTAITEILNYVPNPSIAIEMLLDIHVPQKLDASNRFRKYKHSDSIIEITSIDELGNKVYFTRYDQKTQNVYYLTREDRDNKIFQLEQPKDYYTTGSVPANGYSTRTDFMELQDFNKSYSDNIISVEAATQKFEDWMIYGL